MKKEKLRLSPKYLFWVSGKTEGIGEQVWADIGAQFESIRLPCLNDIKVEDE